MTTITPDESTRRAHLEVDLCHFARHQLEPALCVRFGALDLRVRMGTDQDRMDLALAILSIGRPDPTRYRAEHVARLKPLTAPAEQFKRGPYVVIDGETLGAETKEAP